MKFALFSFFVYKNLHYIYNKNIKYMQNIYILYSDKENVNKNHNKQCN